MLNLSELTDKVRALAIEAGDFIREERKKFHREAIEKKHAHDYVSYVDKESEKKIVTRLKELLPEAGFIAEEGSGTLNDEQYCWLVDPLDGTTNFIHDNAPYCVSIALRSKKELLLGVVYEICRNECFWTYKGAPSYLNDNEIHVSAISNLDDSFIALGFPYATEEYKPMANHLVNTLYGNVAGLRLMGAAAVELLYCSRKVRSTYRSFYWSMGYRCRNNYSAKCWRYDYRLQGRRFLFLWFTGSGFKRKNPSRFVEYN